MFLVCRRWHREGHNSLTLTMFTPTPSSPSPPHFLHLHPHTPPASPSHPTSLTFALTPKPHLITSLPPLRLTLTDILIYTPYHSDYICLDYFCTVLIPLSYTPTITNLYLTLLHVFIYVLFFIYIYI